MAYGARTSLEVGFVASGCSAVIALLLGASAGYFGGVAVAVGGPERWEISPLEGEAYRRRVQMVFQESARYPSAGIASIRRA
jgi:ABC-type dipeptide/oligopeptide/nickel transport system ATPase subunit